MAIACRRLIDRVLQLELLYDFCRAKVENLSYLLSDSCIGKTVSSCAISVYEDADRLCHTDCVSELHQDFVSHAGCHQVLGDISCRISCRTVYL